VIDDDDDHAQKARTGFGGGGVFSIFSNRFFIFCSAAKEMKLLEKV
jgi:hypothetical protein